RRRVRAIEVVGEGAAARGRGGAGDVRVVRERDGVERADAVAVRGAAQDGRIDVARGQRDARDLGEHAERGRLALDRVARGAVRSDARPRELRGECWVGRYGSE